MDDEQGYPYFRKPPYLTNNSSVRKSIRTHLSTPQKDGSTVTKVYSWNAADLLIIRSHSFGTTLGERDWQAVEFYPIYKLSYVRCRKPCCWLYPIQKTLTIQLSIVESTQWWGITKFLVVSHYLPIMVGLITH